MLLLSITIVSCDSTTQETTTAESDSMALADPTQNELNSNQNQLLKEILSESSTGTVRGISFGDPVSAVKANENYEMFEELPDHLGYTHETDQLETIDIQYFLTTDGKVNKIEIDVYLNSPQATKELWNSGKHHFTENFGPVNGKATSLNWEHNDVKVQMEDVSKGKDFGLKFIFHPVNKNVFARNK